MEAGRRHDGLVYATHDGQPLAGDLYLPAGPGPHPTLLAAPGGAWRYAKRGALQAWGAHLASQGFAVFSVDYRQATHGSTFPQAAQDVYAAAQFLCGAGPRYGLDTARLGLLGASAGAHLASLIALAGDRAPICGAYLADEYAALRPEFRALIAVYGIYDLVRHWQDTRTSNAAPGEDITERFMGGSPYEDQTRYAQASPLRQVSYARNRLAVLLVWGEQDDAVSPAQSHGFRLALEQARFTVRSCPVPGAGHYWFSNEPIEEARGHAAYVAPRIVRFLRQYLDGRGG
jgi:acetyl esterase/lipase